MSIEQFGESLLGDIRKRRQDEERRARKRADRQALLGLGVGIAAKIGNEMLANKANDFLKQEQKLVNDLARNKSVSYVSQLNSYRNAIEAGGDDYAAGDVVGYAMTNFGGLDAQAKENLSNVYMEDSRAYDAIIRKEKQRLAEEWAADYNEAIILADEIADNDSFEAMLKLNAKKANPTNIGSYVTQKVASMFGGKSKEEFKEEAFEAITDEMEDAKKLNTFMASFQTFGDMVRAYEFTEDVFPKEAFNANKTKKISEKEDVLEAGDNVYRIKRIQTQNLLDPTESSTETIEYLDKDENGNILPVFSEDPEETEAKALKADIAIFNPAKLAVQELNNAGLQEFIKRSQQLNVANPHNPQTREEYNNTAFVLNTIITKSKGLLDDPERQEIIGTALNSYLTGVTTAQIIRQQAGKKPQEEINIALRDIMRNNIEIARSVFGDPTLPEEEDYGIIDYSRIDSALNQ